MIENVQNQWWVASPFLMGGHGWGSEGYGEEGLVKPVLNIWNYYCLISVLVKNVL